VCACVHDPLSPHIDGCINRSVVLRDDVSRKVAGGDQKHLFSLGERMTQSRRVVVAALPDADSLIGQVRRTRGIADADADIVCRHPLQQKVDSGSIEGAGSSGDDDHLKVLWEGGCAGRMKLTRQVNLLVTLILH